MGCQGKFMAQGKFMMQTVIIYGCEPPPRPSGAYPATNKV